ncbi:MAG: hypothetical protein IJT51_04640 [Bacteroidales bacterium]|nr:hypothetical protein [Bacteroidales bacterium]
MSAGITYFPQKDLNYPLSIGNLSAARYYPSAPLRNRNSDLSIWISVDPLSDKYQNLSPYVYCANNPVRLVDEDGREIGPIWPKKGVNTYSCKLKAGIGIAYGVSISGMSGISLDSHGMTHWTAYNSKYFVNQNLYDGSMNPAIEVGIDVSLSGSFERNSHYDSFIESIKSSSVIFNLSGNALVGGSLGLGDDSFSVGIGVGVSIGASSDPNVITESISLSKSEAKKIGYTSKWTVGEQKYDPSTNTYQSVVHSNGEKTNVKVSCSPTESDGVRKPDGMWYSTDYWSK